MPTLLYAQPWVERLGWTLVHFLWQGALIAILYAIARNRLRRARSPQVRYLLGCAALIAMAAAPIVTFSLTAPSASSAGNTVIAVPHIPSHIVGAASTSIGPLPALAMRAWRDDVMPWIVLAWFAGVIIFWVRLMGGWMVAARMRSMLVRPAPAEWQRTLDELRARIRILRPVKLLVSALVRVPTAAGWLRPVVLVPVGALAGLPAEHVEAILAHELAHIRRHDYLVNILQSVAEALLFYHPAVWWISNHIRSEREHCCDDVAVAINGDAIVYARALAGLEAYRPARFHPALAANGGSLPERIARLLGVSRADSRSPLAPGIIVSAILLVAACCVLAQPTAPREFEVASVKMVQPPFDYSKFDKGNGKLNFKAASLTDCLTIAYGINRRQIVGPDWLDQERYDFVANAPAGTPDGQLLPMLQSLLAARFGMVVHREIRDISVYALTTAKSGPKLQPTKESVNSIIPVRGTPNAWTLKHISMAQFVDFLTLFGAQRDRLLDRPIIDKTGIQGAFDFQFAWTPEKGQASADATADTSIFTAVQDQLGLKLEARKGPVEVLVVDHVEKVPTEN